tara:strand:- start:551 stop:1477 length:927 start_codon:yes stop_codon:yes gene_type:complete
MPAVTVSIPVQNDNSPHTPNIDTTVDLAMLLSEYYGKNIRQGNNFRVKAMQATLVPADNAALAYIDTGLSATVRTTHLPTTKHSRRAWNEVFRQWKRQKQLGGLVGSSVRNDDMEFAWKSDMTTSRTSTIHGTGLGDTSTEKLVLTGDSTGGVDFSLQDYYNSMHKPPQDSSPHFSSGSIKDNKYGDTMFPAVQDTVMACYNSTNAFIDWAVELGVTIIDSEAYTSAAAAGPINEFPAPLDVFGGLMRIRAYVMPDDTAVQIEEDFSLFITFHVESWKPLIYRRKSGRNKSRGRGWFGRGRKSYTRKR